MDRPSLLSQPRPRRRPWHWALALASALALSIPARSFAAAPVSVPAPAPSVSSPSPTKATVFTNTSEVEDLIVTGGSLWVATRGGIEQYALPGYSLLRTFTTAHGLDDNFVHALEPAASAASPPLARTATSRCTLRDDSDGRNTPAFHCEPAAPLAAAQPSVAPTFQGARVTRRLSVGSDVLVGTAGRGVWLDSTPPRRLTPVDQIAANHVMAFARFQGRVWLGTFDRGLSSFDGARFSSPTTPFRMVNDLLVSGDSLWIAASEGLFRTRDGVRFERVRTPPSAPTTGFNSLASDGKIVYATAPSALLRITGRRVRVDWRPGGSRALQSVSVGGGAVWIASEDRGAIRERDGLVDVFDRAAGLPSSWVVDVSAAPDGGAFAATLRHGLVRIDRDGKVRSVTGLPDEWMLRVTADASGRGAWVGTQGGAGHLDDKGAFSALGGVPNPCVHAVFEDGAALWVATEGGTLRATR